MNREVHNGRQEAANCIRVHGARTHNLQNLDLALPRDRLVVRHRPQRVGQELAGLRHALCRRTAAIYRKPLALRPAVPPPTRTARRRSDRGPATDDLHRSAGRQPQSPQHGGHGHRDLRLPAAALCPAGRIDLLPVRHADPPAVAGADSGDAALPAHRHADDDPGADRSRPQGAAPRGDRGHPQGRLRPARIDGEVLEVNEPPELVPQKAHTIEAVVDRVVIREGVEPRLAESIRLAVRHGEGLVLASCEVRKRTAAGPAVARRAFQHALFLPRLQDQLRRDRAADLQLQQPLRRLPGVRGLGAAWPSTRTW